MRVIDVVASPMAVVLAALAAASIPISSLRAPTCLSSPVLATAFALALLTQSPPRMQCTGETRGQLHAATGPSQDVAVRFDVNSAIPVDIPVTLRSRIENDLGYRSGDTVLGVRTDLNGNGVAEYLLIGSARMCGTGGCSILILDGRTGARRGKVFGKTLAIFRPTRADRYAALETYTHGSASTGELDRWRFAGRRYRIVSRRSLSSHAVDSLFTVWNRLPSIPSTGHAVTASASCRTNSPCHADTRRK